MNEDTKQSLLIIFCGLYYLVAFTILTKLGIY